MQLTDNSCNFCTIRAFSLFSLLQVLRFTVTNSKGSSFRHPLKFCQKRFKHVAHYQKGNRPLELHYKLELVPADAEDQNEDLIIYLSDPSYPSYVYILLSTIRFISSVCLSRIFCPMLSFFVCNFFPDLLLYLPFLASLETLP